MSKLDEQPLREREPWTHPVALVGLALVLVHVCIRGWGAFTIWFYADDFEFLRLIETESFGVDYLLTPHNGHLMPWGRLLVWLSTWNGPLDWNLTATLLVLCEATVALTAWWMFLTLFGRRWGALAPLTIFLFTPITLPSSLWWAAAINQQGVLVALMGSITAWVNHERTGRSRWLAAVVAFLAFGLASDPRAVMVVPALAFFVLAWFHTGGLRSRMRQFLTRRWASSAVVATLSAAYAGYYLLEVPNHTRTVRWAEAPGLAYNAIVQSFGPAIIGGPWTWSTKLLPLSLVDPPAFAVTLAWIGLVAVASVAALTRVRTLRAWAFIGVYVVLLATLAMTTRAEAVGAIVGLELRYWTELAAVGALAFGLAFMPVVGAPGSSRPRSKPLLVLPERQRLVLVALAMAVVVVGGTASALPYIRSWQDDTFRRDYVTTLAESVRQQAPVDLAETQVPERVVPDLMWPEDRMRRLTSTFATRPSYPRVSDRLGVVAGNGAIVRAEVQKNAVRSEPGPISGCGWRLGRSTTIPLQSRTINGEFWMRIGYLSGGPSEVTVRAGSTTVRASLQSGLNDLWVLTNGGFDAVTLTDVKPGVTVCVDTIEVGAVKAGDPMP